MPATARNSSPSASSASSASSAASSASATSATPAASASASPAMPTPSSFETKSFLERGQALRDLGNENLLRDLRSLVRQERALEIDILLHLIEVKRRKLHLELGLPSLFHYCTDRLGYKRSAAYRRTQAARCLARFPEVGRAVEARRVTISTICMVAKILTKRNVNDVLRRIAGKSQSAVERVVAEFRDPVVVLERVNPVQIPVSADDVANSAANLAANPAADLAANPAMDPAADPATDPAKNPAADLVANPVAGFLGDSEPTAANVATPEESVSPSRSSTKPGFRILVVLDEEQMAKLNRAQELASAGGAHATLPETVVLAVETYLDKNCPERRNARREKRKAEKAESSKRDAVKMVPGTEEGKEPASQASQALPASGTSPTSPTRKLQRRKVPVAIRDAVFARDGGRCAYIGQDGRRCKCAADNLDHIQPIACGGSDDVDNLRSLCAAHNQLEADRLLGREFMDSFRGQGDNEPGQGSG